MQQRLSKLATKNADTRLVETASTEPEPRQIARSGAHTRPGLGRAAARLDRNLADLAQQLLGELPALRVVNLEGPLGCLDQRPSHAPYAERRRQLAQLADLGGEGFRSHVCNGT